jgi:hypothetical protein
MTIKSTDKLSHLIATYIDSLEADNKSVYHALIDLCDVYRAEMTIAVLKGREKEC